LVVGGQAGGVVFNQIERAQELLIKLPPLKRALVIELLAALVPDVTRDTIEDAQAEAAYERSFG
jgi:hypothetical protein